MWNQNNSAQNEKSRRGSILLVCLGVLALLSLLGTSLIFMTRQESKDTQAYVAELRARFAAESGIETAIAKLQSQNIPPIEIPKHISCQPANSALPLEFISQSSFGILNLNNRLGNETAGILSETYAKNSEQYRLRVTSCQSKLNLNDTNSPMNYDSDPFEDQLTPDRDYSGIPKHMRHPSGKDPDWAYGPAVRPNQDPDVNLDGWVNDLDTQTVQAVFQGKISNPILKSRANLNGDKDALGNPKVDFLDTADSVAWQASGFDPFRSPDGKPHIKGPRRLESILEYLLNALIPEPSIPFANTSRAKMASRLLLRARGNLPNDRFDNMTQVENALVRPGLLTKNEFKVLEAHVTLNAWQDKHVLQPSFQWRVSTPPPLDATNPLTAHVQYWPGEAPYSNEVDAFGMTSVGLVPFVRPNLDQTNNRDIYIYSDMQTKHFQTEWRSPIDVNDASKELIQALISPIRGWYLKEAPGNGEGPTAEDWSQGQIADALSGGWTSGVAMGQFAFPFWNAERLLCFENSFFGVGYVSYGWGFSLADRSQYYYYDEKFRSFLLYVPSSNSWKMQEIGKNARYGKLEEVGRKSITGQPLGLSAIAENLADKIHQRIHGAFSNAANENPFETWEEFEDFILGLVAPNPALAGTGNPDALNGFDEYMAHTLIANFNPNSRVNDCNPNKRIYLHTDKSQLIQNSAEFCFYPMGRYSIESLGLVFDGQGEKKSLSRAKSIIQLHEPFILTSQAEFMQGFDGNTVNAGSFFSSSTGLADTAGSSTGFAGYTLQSYPEPECAGKNYIASSIFDGYLMPAHYKPRPAELYAENGIVRFLANFDGSLNADYALGVKDAMPSSTAGQQTWFAPTANRPGQITRWSTFFLPDTKYQVPANHPGCRPLTQTRGNYLAQSEVERIPGNLLVDGALSDVGRGLGFSNTNNLGEPGDDSQWNKVRGRRGAMQFWIKPNFDVAHSNRIRKFFCCRPNPEGLDPTGQVADDIAGIDLFYFSRGGARVPNDLATGQPSDNIHISYAQDPSMNMNGQWLPTRSLFMNVNNRHYSQKFDATSTTSCNQSWRDPAKTADSPNEYQFNMESRQWSHVAMSWDLFYKESNVGGGWPVRPVNHDWIRLALNGRYMDGRSECDGLTNMHNEMTEFYSPRLNSGTFQAPPSFMRFGENSDALWGHNESADATFDDIASSSIYHNYDDLIYEFGYGRYYNSDDALYTSPEFNLASELALGGTTLTLYSIHWTVYLPRNENVAYLPNHPRWNDNLDANISNKYLSYSGIAKTLNGSSPADGFPLDPMFTNGGWNQPWTPVSVDIFDPNTGGGQWHYESAEYDKHTMPNYAGGSMDANWQSSPLHWETGQTLRFRIHFNLDGAFTLFSPPVLDDITFIFKLDQPKILSWEISD